MFNVHDLWLETMTRNRLYINGKIIQVHEMAVIYWLKNGDDDNNDNNSDKSAFSPHVLL